MQNVSGMGEDIAFWPARQIKLGAGRKKAETRLRQFAASLARKAGFKLVVQRVEVEHIRGGIFDLSRGQLVRAPVRALLLLGDIDAQHFLKQEFQPVPVGIGAPQFRGDLGTIDRRSQHAKAMQQNGDIETAEMKQLEHIRIGQHGAEIGRFGLVLIDLHQMGVAVAARHLHQAKPVAMRDQTHGFTINRHDRAEIKPIGEVAFVEMVCHGKALCQRNMAPLLHPAGTDGNQRAQVLSAHKTLEPNTESGDDQTRGMFIWSREGLRPMRIWCGLLAVFAVLAAPTTLSAQESIAKAAPSQAGGDIAPRLIDEAFAAAQWAMLSSAGNAIAQTSQRKAAGTGPLADLMRERQVLADKITATEAALAVTGSDVAGGARDEKLRLSGEIDALGAALVALDRRIADAFPDFHRLTQPTPMSISEVQQTLAEDEGLLVVFTGTRDSFVWAITPQKVSWHRVGLPSVSIADNVTAIRASLIQANLSRSAAALDDETPSARIAPFERLWAYLLYRELLLPHEATLQGVRHLYSVVDGPLTGLPLSLLVTDEQLRGDDADPEALRKTGWLFQRHALTTLPTVESLRLVAAARAAQNDTAELAFLGFGDPDFAGVMAPGEASLYRAGGANLDSIRALARLPGTRREVRALAEILGPEQSRLFLGAQASEHNLRQNLQHSARVIAFATHGLLSGELRGLAEPALVLSPPEVAEPDNDGLLTASEIAELPLEADWILLSACNTAGSDGTPDGEGLSGLARAFLFAGARTILVSHWPVRDDAAARLTTETFRYLAEGGGTRRKAEALQSAMQDMLNDTDDDSLSHPAAWAPFVIVGDGGAG